MCVIINMYIVANWHIQVYQVMDAAVLPAPFGPAIMYKLGCCIRGVSILRVKLLHLCAIYLHYEYKSCKKVKPVSHIMSFLEKGYVLVLPYPAKPCGVLPAYLLP